MRRPLTQRLKRRHVARKVAESTASDEEYYQIFLDLLDEVEYNGPCQDVDEEIGRRYALLDAVHDSVNYDGRTDTERELEHEEQYAKDDDSLRRLISGLRNGTAAIDTELGTGPSWESGRRADLKSNYLYSEYMQQVLSSPAPMHFQLFCEVVAGKAFLHMMTRMRGRKDIIREFIGGSGNLPRLSDAQEFIILDKHRERDGERFLAMLYAEVPGSKPIVQKMLNYYAELVREEWRKMRVKPESPLPGEPDWLFANADESDTLHLAVEAYIAGAGLNRAAAMFKIGNRRLREALEERGVLRQPKKKKGGTSV